MTDSKRAVVLLSGGLDSATVLALAVEAGYTPSAISFRYGQRHEHEITRACQIAANYRVARHLVLDVDLRALGGSALTDQIEVPKSNDADQISDGIPVTYVPARNTIFLSLALGWAETLDIGDIFIGVNALDYSGYPDCRPQYINAFQQLANLATKAAVLGTRPVTIHAPLIDLTKAQIIRRGLELQVDYSLTTSCYDPAADGSACGRCDACLLRLRGFSQNGIVDPVKYTR